MTLSEQLAMLIREAIAMAAESYGEGFDGRDELEQALQLLRAGEGGAL